jgi:coenzyme F420-reducing hydrogenase alpha subunit
MLPEWVRMGLSKEEIQFRVEKDVRDHNPCSSCAVHGTRKAVDVLMTLMGK